MYEPEVEVFEFMELLYCPAPEFTGEVRMVIGVTGVTIGRGDDEMRTRRVGACEAIRVKSPCCADGHNGRLGRGELHYTPRAAVLVPNATASNL